MREETFNGKVYKTDGKKMWIDDMKVDITMPEKIHHTNMVEVLSINNGEQLYYNEKFYQVNK